MTLHLKFMGKQIDHKRMNSLFRIIKSHKTHNHLFFKRLPITVTMSFKWTSNYGYLYPWVFCSSLLPTTPLSPTQSNIKPDRRIKRKTKRNRNEIERRRNKTETKAQACQPSMALPNYSFFISHWYDNHYPWTNMSQIVHGFLNLDKRE